METFPTCLFGFTDAKPELVRRNIRSGSSLSGIVEVIDTGGAGYWSFDLSGASLRTREQNLEWRRLDGVIGDNATRFIFPINDRRHQPLTAKVDDAPQVTAALTADAALNATTVIFDFAGPIGLVGGEHFSIDHPTLGRRLYRIIEVVSGSDPTDAYSVKIRPWLREAAASGTALDFDDPGFLARVDGSMAASVNLLRFGVGALKIVEAMPDA